LALEEERILVNVHRFEYKFLNFFFMALILFLTRNLPVARILILPDLHNRFELVEQQAGGEKNEYLKGYVYKGYCIDYNTMPV